MKNTILAFYLLQFLPGGITAAYSQKFNTAGLSYDENQTAICVVANVPTTSSNDRQSNAIFSAPGGKNPAGDTNFIGKSCKGGTIFWLDATGKHGLVAATVDQSPKGIAWNPGGAMITGANADELYAGHSNTRKITDVQGKNAGYAAKLCDDFSTTVDNVVYDDWYLPSRYELNLLFKQRMVVGGFNTSSGIYWSSTETTTKPSLEAWEQEFRFGSQLEDKKNERDQVRCIRKF